jgi:ABC-2 type transport system ATP-binding protein
MTTTPVLEYDHVARAFRPGRPVLADVSFSVHAEDVVALLGRNGAGKTTLIHLALGLLFPQAGRVQVFGMSPTDHPVAVKRRVGYVAEDQVLPPAMRIPEILAFHRRVFPSWDAAFERELLDRFGLAGDRSRLSQLSKGQARQVALICALCHRPELLILDEPAGGLDPAARREVLETSIQLLNREGTAILFSSHHMTDVERLGGRVVVLDEGRVALDETLDELREQHCVAVVSRHDIAHAAEIARVTGCLHVRMVLGEWHAVFRGAPSLVRARLREQLGLDDVSCETVPLEELFVDLLGDERMAGAP